jgi:CheY-like chemotaxis protein
MSSPLPSSFATPFDCTSSEQPRVLLVDDNQAILDRASAVLSPDCIVVGAVTDGCAALEAAAALQPDVIVLDISMPGMCGLEVAARLRAAGSRAAVVFLTVHDDEDVIRAARGAGGVAYVLKPRLVSDLLFAALEASAGRPFVSGDLGDVVW